MAYLSLDNPSNFDPRALAGTGLAWLLATAACRLLFRRTKGSPALWWQPVVRTALVSIATLVFVTIGVAFAAPPQPV